MQWRLGWHFQCYMQEVCAEYRENQSTCKLIKPSRGLDYLIRKHRSITKLICQSQVQLGDYKHATSCRHRAIPTSLLHTSTTGKASARRYYGVIIVSFHVAQLVVSVSTQSSKKLMAMGIVGHRRRISTWTPSATIQPSMLSVASSRSSVFTLIWQHLLKDCFAPRG